MYTMTPQEELEFTDRIARSLEPLLCKPFTRITADCMAEAVISQIRDLESRQKQYVPFEGLRLARPKIVMHEKSKAVICWDTEFYPFNQPRFMQARDDGKPLGFFKEYDLYVKPAEDRQFILVLRYGHNPEDRYELNPFQPYENEHVPMLDCFVEALERANYINFQAELK